MCVWPSGLEEREGSGSVVLRSRSGAGADMLADEFLPRITKHLAHGWIDLHVVPFQIDDRQAIGSGFKDAAIQRFALAQLALGLHLLSDVAGGGQRVRLAAIGDGAGLCIEEEGGPIFTQAAPYALVGLPGPVEFYRLVEGSLRGRRHKSAPV